MKNRKIKLEKLKVSSFNIPFDSELSNTVKAGRLEAVETKNTPYGCSVTWWFSNCYQCKPTDNLCPKQ